MKSTLPTPLSELPARERILRTAHELFYRDGIRATGVDKVIAEAGVTKVTFYRHFPSKNQLILAFLDYRHQRWISWFADAMQRYGHTPQAILPSMAEWFTNGSYRGCAFINTVVELGDLLPEVRDIARRHKQDMVELIIKVLPPGPQVEEEAIAIALVIDGAIIRAQFDENAQPALQALERVLLTLLGTCRPQSSDLL
jgi:AcrR family transcriptional regulator